MKCAITGAGESVPNVTNVAIVMLDTRINLTQLSHRKRHKEGKGLSKRTYLSVEEERAVQVLPPRSRSTQS